MRVSGDGGLIVGKFWDRLRAAASEAGRPPLPDPEDLAADPDPRRRQRHDRWGAPPPESAAASRTRYPDVAPPITPGTVHMDAGALMAEGDVLTVGPREVRSEAGRHAFVVAVWYQVDPLELQDGGRFSLYPDQVLGTLPPCCYFCEVQWSYTAMRTRCPGDNSRRR